MIFMNRKTENFTLSLLKLYSNELNEIKNKQRNKQSRYHKHKLN